MAWKPSEKGRFQAVSEINMTPFIDVMLVLLIIFMITAPLLTVGVDVNLPKSQASTITESKKPIVVSINKNNHLFLQEQRITRAALLEKLSKATKGQKETKVYIQADEVVKYGTLMDIMGLLNHAGYKKVALIGEAIDS